MTDETETALRKQVADQCQLVAHLATALAGVHSDYERAIREGFMTPTLDMVGARTASFMEQLGEMLNGMDAVLPEDRVFNPVFHEAHKRWPRTPA
jgi:hypothetical protein